MNNRSRAWRPFSRHFASLSATVLVSAVFWAHSLFGEIPSNIDSSLRRVLVAEEQNQIGKAAAQVNAAGKPTGIVRLAVRDAQRRVLVNIRLNGQTSLADVRQRLIDAGARVMGENSSYRKGVISAFVPVAKVAELARGPGVLSMSLGRRPIKNIGAATSGGVPVLRTDVLNTQGLDGTGETIGVLSDSFNTAVNDLNGDPLTIHEAEDIASGDLPGPGNPNNPNPVFIIEEYNPGPDDPVGNDEGRAMLQIVHDIAPKAKLAFATAFISMVDFADNIRKLRTDANCDVIIDDVFYTEEPMFSDGILAQAVDDVVNSTVLAGPKCAYFSSAGNQQGGGYFTTFKPVSDAAARAPLAGQNLKLEQVDSALTSGGFHNFNNDPMGFPDISQRFVIPAGESIELDFQWNDPFDIPSGGPIPGVTTDYNILIFDADGNFLQDMSGIANNFDTQQPLEDIMVENTGSEDASFQVVIARAGNIPATPVAQKIRYLALDQFGGATGPEEHYLPKAPATFGHNCANGAFGTAAYVYDEFPSVPPGPPFEPFLEDFTSQGPATIDFDANGNRLANSEIRLKPDIAAPDGGNNTFFGFDYEGDNLPNFFGTSAAAPHAGGVAALLLQKAGGPASLTMEQLKNALQSSVLDPHDLDPFFSQATAESRGRRRAGATLTVTACGNSTNSSSRDPNFFTITFNPSRPRESLRAVTIDLRRADLKFDSTTDTGFPFTIGKTVGFPRDVVTTNIPAETDTISLITLFFPRGVFRAGSSITFGIDRDFIGDGAGNQADLLQGGEVIGATTRNNIKGVFENDLGFGFSIVDGFGLIDAVKAADQIGDLTRPTAAKNTPALDNSRPRF